MFEDSVREVNPTKPELLDICVEGYPRKRGELYPNKLPENWENITVRTASVIIPPYVFFQNGYMALGMEPEILRLVQSFLGFQIDYTDKRYNYWGAQNAAGEWSEAYGDLQRYEVDLAIGGFFVGEEQYWDFDMTFPYMEDKRDWVMPAARLMDNWKSLKKVFKWKIWLLLPISVVYSAFFMHIAGTYRIIE